MRKEIICLNNGTLILRLGKYMHCYDGTSYCDKAEANQLCRDLLDFYKHGTTEGWEGNEYKELSREDYTLECDVYDLSCPTFIHAMLWSGSAACKYFVNAFLGVEIEI